MAIWGRKKKLEKTEQPAAPPAESMSEEQKHLKDVAQLLYGQNAELANRNKTLSLLRKLYQFSIQNFEPEQIATNITQAIRDDLNYELVGILTFDEATDELKPLKFARSERLAEARKAITDIPFHAMKIQRPLPNPILETVMLNRSMCVVNGLAPIWQDVFTTETLKKVSADANIKTSIIYPLVIEKKTIGVLIMALNHEYETLSKFEKESIESFVNVVAVALDRAFLYQELKVANEKLKELDKLKSEFLSFASHQVKAPMAVVKGYAEIIRDGQLGAIPDKVKEMTEKIINSANRLIDLVNNLLDMRKAEEGKMNYTFEDVDLIKMTKEIVDELHGLAVKKGLDLSLDVRIQSAKIKADAQKFKQTILNFVDNSIKYTPAGWVKVTINNDAKTPGNILIAVTDSGLGISDELLPKLFQQFSRDKGETGKKILGTGLGLFIAKKIIEDHGGKVWAESAGEGKGSQFYVSIKSI